MNCLDAQRVSAGIIYRESRLPSGNTEVTDYSCLAALCHSLITVCKIRFSNAGPTGLDAVPAVLESEVALMCSELGNESLGLTAPWEKSKGEVGGLKWWTGCHVSTSGGIEKAVINAAAIGGDFEAKCVSPACSSNAEQRIFQK